MQQKGLACMACSHVGKGWVAGWVKGEITSRLSHSSSRGLGSDSKAQS